MKFREKKFYFSEFRENFSYLEITGNYLKSLCNDKKSHHV